MSAPARSHALQRFNNLTVARFAAALLVYFHHLTPVEYEAMTSPFWKTFSLNGHIGVSFFFILSGFVLAASNLDRLGVPTWRGTLSFYWKRGARIIPLWLVVSAPFIVAAIRNDDPRMLSFLTFTQAWSSDVQVSYALLAVAWTLSVEVFFYATFPLIAAAVHPFKGKSLGPALIALGLLIPTAGAIYYLAHPELAIGNGGSSSHRWLYRSPIMRLGEFIMGIGVYLTIVRFRMPLGRLGSGLLLGAAIALLFIAMGTLDFGKALWVMPYAPIFAVIVLMLAQLENLDLRITWKLPILLGEASFAFYLIHQFYFKDVFFPALVPLTELHVAQIAVLVMAISTSIGLHLSIEAPARDGLLRLLHIRSTMPKVVVTETVP